MLCARGDGNFYLFAIERLDVDIASKRCGGKIDFYRTVQVLVVALEVFVGSHMDKYIEVSRGSGVGT